ncbi:MAG: LytTR family DNA-binding domain-containing protein [Bacteroidales bacterium]|nr:LytTR family DNA-binding domain-containing protein [Bacteroidales bacterium]
MFNFRKKSELDMLRTLIIDDEAHFRESLSNMLKLHCPNAKLVGKAEGVKSGVEAIMKYHPDLILLDIKMKDGTGFDLLKKTNNIDFKVIFITAYDQYAIKAFKFSALDYLLKPVESHDLKEAIDKADKISQKEVNIQLDTLANNLQTNDQTKKKIILKTFDNVYLLKVKEIIYVESDGRYSTFFLESGENVMVSNTLKHYQEMLIDFGFFRVHKSYLINLNHIHRFEKAEGGYVILTDDAKVPVASRKRDQLLEMFNRITEY